MLFDEDDNPTDPRFRARVEEQGPRAQELRTRPVGDPPWPDPSDPILEYLCARAAQINEEEGASAAIIWLATHAFFEGGIAEHSRSSSSD